MLERVFPKVYGLDFGDVIHDEDLALGTFRRAVSIVIPEMTRVALLNRKNEIVADTPSPAHRKYLYYLSRTDYERQWGREYRRPGVGARFLALLLKILPKRGPLSALNFKIPPPQAEDLFVKSIDETVQSYNALLQDSQQGRLDLANKDCDTGRETSPAEYSLADTTYARLLNDLADNHFDKVSPELRENILDFYANPGAPQATKHKAKVWKKVQGNLQALRQTDAVAPSTKPDAGGRLPAMDTPQNKP